MNATASFMTRMNDNSVNLFESSFNHYFQRNEGISKSARLLQPVQLEQRIPIAEMTHRWLAKLKG